MNTNKRINPSIALALLLLLGTSPVFAAADTHAEWEQLNKQSVELLNTGHSEP
ncbi:MAG: hypothetical protein QJT81_04275 [Candidatus Thiothrix putei]|uniref:Uncharacterized protein n=1 Tax=Candidatus Thiothrix putei TaxID=3080811 RepID=A0AA95HD44_9GAMM|nr:MAG: hypothetical protein QJT81_04275 [Candidatus Thiothrix putei]